MKKFRKNNKKGFTLIELIVVVAILVALMLMLVPRLTGFTKEATKTANAANARALYTAIKASESAETTKLYPKRSTENSVTACTVMIYKEFWDEDAEKAGKHSCTVTKDGEVVTSVTYGSDETTKGTYPLPEDTTGTKK